MKKVLQTLFLISFLAVLVVPTIVLGASCPICQTPSADCSCGTATLSPGGGLYCANASTGARSDSVNGCNSLVGSGTQAGLKTIPNNINSINDLINKINTIGDWIFTGLLTLAAIFMVVAGYFFVTARGDPGQVGKAREILINALIGVAVALASKGVVAVIESLLR